MKYRLNALLATLLLTTPFGLTFSAGGGGGGGFSSPQPAVQRSPEQISAGHYKSGVKQKEKAWKQEEKAAKADTDKKRDKALAKAAKHYQRAVKLQNKSLEANPRNYEAANELGYALRRIGDYEKALVAYNHALRLNPNYYPAIEYRGEAYLHLDRIEDSKAAYMTLFRSDADLAAQLMQAMETWVNDQANNPAAQELSSWIEERKQAANLTQDVSQASRW